MAFTGFQGSIMRILVALSIFCAAVGAGLAPPQAQAHEVVPAISDLTIADGKLTLSVETPLAGC
jgi:hypothetical protein